MPNIDIKNDIDAIQNLFPWFKQPEYCFIKKNGYNCQSDKLLTAYVLKGILVFGDHHRTYMILNPYHIFKANTANNQNSLFK